ncbi:MAG: DUF3089 domain-containing protein [Pseudomonadales bacterium]|nr:DUF3089 domain-containing protein [Pseudomonadales bacterium]
MNKTVAILLVSFVVIIVAGIVVTRTGVMGQLMTRSMAAVYGPQEDFDPATAAPLPDYRSAQYWASLPGKDDPADLVPQGVAPRQEPASVDVFFIHPTGYLSGASWNSPMDPNSAAEENTEWMMANQASAYNGCCDIYAPRYREATIFAYFAAKETREKALDFAYQDVAAAFDYFIDHYSQGRPFIVASHSQGSHHARRLLKEKIDGTPLAARMVAAYPIGSVMVAWSKAYFASLKDIHPCASATDTGCVVTWDTFSEHSDGISREEDTLCVNPLSWHIDEKLAPADENLGAVPISIPYNLNFSKENEPAGVSFTQLDAPLPGRTWAQCRNGNLYVEDQGNWGTGGAGIGGSYHGLDYALFYMNIRQNAIDRTNAWLKGHR